MKKKIFGISLIILIVDIILKQLTMNNLEYSEEIMVVPNFFYVTYLRNTGGAFSILDNNIYFLIIIGMLALGGLIFYLLKKESFRKLEVISYGILIGGILGNFIDRIIYNGVIDYIGLIFGSYYFPVFNFADICIVVGIIILILDELVGEKYGIRSNKR